MSRLAASFVVVAALLRGSASPVDSDADRTAVRAAILDYVEGVYHVDPSRIERSVHPKLAKTGFHRPRDGEDYGPAGAMTFEQLMHVARTWYADRKVRDAAPKEITLYDVLDQTASARLVAEWGIDYFHLAKFDGKWMIVNVLWQSSEARDCREKLTPPKVRPVPVDFLTFVRSGLAVSRLASPFQWTTRRSGTGSSSRSRSRTTTSSHS